MYEVVQGRSDDRDEVARLMWKAFDVTGNLEELKKKEWMNNWAQEEKNEWAYVVKYNDKIVANLAFFSNENNIIRGDTIPFAGVWGVATMPEHRRRGLIKKLFEKAFPIKKVKWWCDIQIPVRHFMRDIWEPKDFVDGSMMMRIVDFEGYCGTVNVPESASESVIVELKDEYCPWNTGVYEASPNSGNLEVESSTKTPEVVLTPLQLSSVISGRTPTSLLRNISDIDCTRETAIKLEAIFPKDNFVCYQRF